MLIIEFKSVNNIVLKLFHPHFKLSYIMCSRVLIILLNNSFNKILKLLL